ncbi:hypothetical protein HID58_073338 [Brassica napus]|uniref:Knottins-like domain-containing protein n=1 Tax=Brassica napus TaxID=3708 RepID=A0ABQ7Z798_BRANA|nr:hypothetical protein HID58_073338 [Brassica napus]
MSKFATIITLLFAYFVLFTTFVIMAKFASIVAFLFAALVLFAAFEAPTTVKRRSCAKGQVERAWSGVCGNNNACKNQCIRLEKARHGSCNYVLPTQKCICFIQKKKCIFYFPC